MAVTYNEITESLAVPSYLLPHRCTVLELRYNLGTRWESGAVVEDYHPIRATRDVPCAALGVGAGSAIEGEQEGQSISVTFYLTRDFRIKPKSAIMFRGKLYEVVTIHNPEFLNVIWVIQAIRRDTSEIQIKALEKYVLDQPSMTST